MTVNVRVRRSRLPRASSLLMIALGIFALLFVSSTIGIALIVIGLIMYLVYGRITGRPEQKT